MPFLPSDEEAGLADWESWNEVGTARAGSRSHSALEAEQALEAEDAVAEAAGPQKERGAAREVAQRYRTWTSDAD
jgi:hypothetical protein